MSTAFATPHCPASTALLTDLSVLDPTRATAPKLRTAARRSLRRRPHLVRDRLAFLRSHSEALERLARHSYWHSNGFAKIRVVRGEAFSVRLHVWGAGEVCPGDVDPHSHRWDFASWIAAGPGIDETIFREVAGPASDGAVEHLRFEYGRNDTQGRLRSPRPAALLRTGVRRHRIGDVYGCAVGTVHTVSPIGRDLVATVVLQGPAVADVNPVYRRDGRPSVVTEHAMTTGELRRILGEVEESIAASCVH